MDGTERQIKISRKNPTLYAKCASPLPRVHREERARERCREPPAWMRSFKGQSPYPLANVAQSGSGIEK